MANLLTGDFGAVLQVSAATLNRLLASMHQNAWEDPDTPSFPHSVGVRLGDVVKVDGVQGTAWAQASVPRIELIDGATDRFLLEVGLRIRYLPDPGSEPLPTYINGTLRAVYALEDIDPNCLGWKTLAKDYLWIRVVEDSVSFTGTTDDDLTLLDTSPLHDQPATPVDDQAMNDRVTRQLVALLSFAFEPAPHHMTSPQFRRGSFKSINQAALPPWIHAVVDLPLGGSAVVIPMSLKQDPPVGSLDSLHNVVLQGRDFAVAVSEETIMSLVQPAVDQIKAYKDTYPGPGTVYRVSMSNATALWEPQGPLALIRLVVDGNAHTDSVLPDLDFHVNQPFQLDFDPGAEELRLWAWSPGVTVNVGWPGLPKGVVNTIRDRIRDTVKAMADAAASKAQSTLSLTSRRQDLVTQLESLDKAADAHFDDAEFDTWGVILRGWISVARRRRPVISFTKIDAGHLSALESWILGGRIDELEWSWRWTDTAHPGGQENFAYKYVLGRQTQGDPSGFGVLTTFTPLPGLDGQGQVCLSLKGVVVDTTTGNLVPVETGALCTRFGFADLWRSAVDRLFLREWAEVTPVGPPQPGPEAGLLEVSARGRTAPGSPNTLVVYVDEAWTDDDARTLRDGLAGCGRDDAGLLVLLLFREGVLAGAGPEVAAGLRELAGGLSAPMVVNEDVHRGWSNAFLMPTGTGQPAWRLTNPDGGVLWTHDGRLAPEELTGILDQCLYPSPPAQPVAIQVDLGSALLSPAVLGSLFEHDHPDRGHCPPWGALQGFDVGSVVSNVSFVRSDSPSLSDDLGRLRAGAGQRSEGEPGVVVVVDGADADEAKGLNEALGPAFTVVPDPDGMLASRVGVRFWPTTVAVGDQASPGGKGGRLT